MTWPGASSSSIERSRRASTWKRRFNWSQSIRPRGQSWPCYSGAVEQGGGLTGARHRSVPFFLRWLHSGGYHAQAPFRIETDVGERDIFLDGVRVLVSTAHHDA